MPVWQYRCKVCGDIHEAPLRPGGTVYLRCFSTREWAWYEASSFRAPAGAGGQAIAVATASGRGKSAAPAARRRAQAPRLPHKSARGAKAARKTAARRNPRGGQKKRR